MVIAVDPVVGLLFTQIANGAKEWSTTCVQVPPAPLKLLVPAALNQPNAISADPAVVAAIVILLLDAVLLAKYPTDWTTVDMYYAFVGAMMIEKSAFTQDESDVRTIDSLSPAATTLLADGVLFTSVELTEFDPPVTFVALITN